jgi:hypothetical protein
MVREDIMAALLTLVRNVAGFAESGRRLKFWTDVAGMPALFVIQTDNEFDHQHGGATFPPRRTIGAEIWLYASTDPETPPGTTLNPLLDAVEAALAPPYPGAAQTLGGLVEHCWIGGAYGQEAKIEIYEGHAGNQAAAIIPVRILVP